MKKSTNLEPFSCQRKRVMFMLTGSRTKFFILLTLVLIVIRIDLFGSYPCNGCGGQIGGNQPCYTVGQIISDFDVMLSGVYAYTVTTTYIGNCQIKEERSRPPHEYYFSTDIYPGGCNCGGPMPPYDLIAYPLSGFVTDYNDTTLGITTGITLRRLEIWLLQENGSIVFSIDDTIPANQTEVIPMSVFQNGHDYIVIGYDLLNNTSTYLSIRKAVNNLEELKIFCTWGIPDTLDIQRKCVTYVGNDSVMIFIQHLDKSGQIIKGSTNVEVGIDQRELTDANAMELSQNYPNPFCTSTTIDFTVRKSSNVILVIYDIQGKEIERLVDCFLVPGNYQFIWNAFKYHCGTFYYQLTSDYAVETKKMVLIK